MAKSGNPNPRGGWCSGPEFIRWNGMRAELTVLGGTWYSAAQSTATDEWVWEKRGLVDPPLRRWPLAVEWTGSRLLVWGGTLWDDDPSVSTQLYDGFLYDPFLDTWAQISSEDAPRNNYGSSTVWTGSKLMVWGGTPWGSGDLNSGAVYDPITGAWQPTTLQGALSSRIFHTTVWTGTEMIVWRGTGDGHDRYDAGAYMAGSCSLDWE